MTMEVTASGPVPRLRWQEAARAWAGEATPMGMALLRAHTPVGFGPHAGALRQSERARVEESEGSMMVVFYTRKYYARYVLEGTKAHVITVRNARALRWVDRVGNPSFAVRVNHPGTKADPFPERALARLRPALAHLFARCVKEACHLG